MLAVAKMQYPKIMYHALDKHVLSDDTKPETINHMSKYERESQRELWQATSCKLSVVVHPISSASKSLYGLEY